MQAVIQLHSDLSVLGQSILFQGLSEGELARVARGVTRVQMPSRSILMSYAQASTMIYILVEGAVKVQVEQPDGSLVVVAVLGPDQVLGELSQADGLGCSATVELLEASVVLRMPAGYYQHLLHTIPTLSANVQRQLAQRLRLATQQIIALTTFGAEGRVAAQIRALAQTYGQPNATGLRQIPFRLTQGTLAAMTGLSRVRVNQVLQRFQAEQIIELGPQFRLLVRDEVALAAYAAAPRLSAP